MFVENGPRPKDAGVSERMSRQKTRGTEPELRLRRELHRRGLRFRLNRPTLPGRPDVVFGPSKVAVFVDGCFWHGCPDHGVTPKTNRDWWEQKLDTNRERDRRKDRALADLGWEVVHVWEHEDPVPAADVIEQLVLSRRGLLPGAVTPRS